MKYNKVICSCCGTIVKEIEGDNEFPTVDNCDYCLPTTEQISDGDIVSCFSILYIKGDTKQRKYITTTRGERRQQIENYKRFVREIEDYWKECNDIFFGDKN